MACLDILDRLGVGDRVVGSASTSLDYLQAYVTDENVSSLGTSRKPTWRLSWPVSRT